MNDDSTKMMDVVESAMKQGHPFALFNCGNKATLFDAFKDKVFLQDLILLFRQYH